MTKLFRQEFVCDYLSNENGICKLVSFEYLMVSRNIHLIFFSLFSEVEPLSKSAAFQIYNITSFLPCCCVLSKFLCKYILKLFL